jgi:NAD(P)-dependent dehydrogenase (short-subunit alcohol dehydrogenase family)
MAAARTTTTKVSTALVTGANRGIGLGIVRELLKRSGVSHVFAGYRSSAKIEVYTIVCPFSKHKISVKFLYNFPIVAFL